MLYDQHRHGEIARQPPKHARQRRRPPALAQIATTSTRGRRGGVGATSGVATATSTAIRRCLTASARAISRRAVSISWRLRSKSGCCGPGGFSTTATAPACNASKAISISCVFRLPLTTTMGVGLSRIIRRVASSPHLRHRDIHRDHVWLQRPGEFQRFLAVARDANHTEALRLRDQLNEKTLRDEAIFDNQHTGFIRLRHCARLIE
ncbi:MAG: hypothetical protein M5R40_23920 [Anaerolineae bacterium]|nr:hypothetical protein [Anaerolineae bacterium]